MPSYAAAPESPPARASEPQPPRILAKRKNAPGGGRPPNPLCCGRLTKRIAPGSSTVMCTLCQKIYPHGTVPQQKPVVPPPPPPPANVLVNEATQIARPKPAPAQVIVTKPAPPGPDGELETYREESKKIPPSRPANNNRGDPEFSVRNEPPPMPKGQTKRGRLRLAIEALGPYPAHIQLPACPDNARLVRDLINDLRRRNGKGDLMHYQSADGTCHVICRKPQEGAVSR